MKLLLDEKTLRCVWSSTGEYWFSRTDYCVHASADLGEGSACLVENGFIPFLTITNEEIIRAYIKFLNNKKVSSVLDRLSAQDAVETFWKYYNAYHEISAGFDDFEREYVLKKAVAWCEENDVDYRL